MTKTSEIPGGANRCEHPGVHQGRLQHLGRASDLRAARRRHGRRSRRSRAPSGSHVSDIYYVCMDGGGDWLPDIYIGRFSCTPRRRSRSLSDKTVKYMRFALSSGTRVGRRSATFMASSDNYTVSEGTHNYCINNWVEPARLHRINKRYSVTYSATTAQCIADINGGISMLTYSGHGSTNGWADGPPMSATQVNALTNVDMLPMVQSYACITGAVHAPCFGETWTLRHERRRALPRCLEQLLLGRGRHHGEAVSTTRGSARTTRGCAACSTRDSGLSTRHTRAAGRTPVLLRDVHGLRRPGARPVDRRRPTTSK